MKFNKLQLLPRRPKINSYVFNSISSLRCSIKKWIVICIILINTHLVIYSQISNEIKLNNLHSNGFSVQPVDTNRSIICGYLELYDNGYDFVDGNQLRMDVRMVGVLNYIRTCTEENYLVLNEQKKIATNKRVNIIETEIPLKINKASFSCYNCKESKPFKAYFYKEGNGYIFYFVNVSKGNWVIEDLMVTKDKKSPNKIYKKYDSDCKEFSDFLILATNYNQSFYSNNLLGKLTLKIRIKDIYYMGSFRISQTRDYIPKADESDTKEPCQHKPNIDNIQFNYSLDTLPNPNEDYILQKLDSLSSGTYWNKMINKKIKY